MFSNAYHVCFYSLILEEGKITKKETHEIAEKLKDQLLEEQWSRNEIIDDYDKLFDKENQDDEIRKEQVAKDRVSRNDLVDEYDKIAKRMKVTQTENGRLWEIKKSCDSTKEVKNYELRKKRETNEFRSTCLNFGIAHE